MLTLFLALVVLVHQTEAHGQNSEEQKHPGLHGKGFWLPHWPHWHCPPCWNPFYCPPCPTRRPPSTTVKSTTVKSTTGKSTTQSTTPTSTTPTSPQPSTSVCTLTAPPPNRCELNFTAPPLDPCNPPANQPSLVVDCYNNMNMYFDPGQVSVLEPTLMDANCKDLNGRRFYYDSVNTTTITEAEDNNQSIVINCGLMGGTRLALCSNSSYCCQPDSTQSSDETYRIDNATVVPYCDPSTGECSFYADVMGTPGSDLYCFLNNENAGTYVVGNQDPADWNTYFKVQYVSCRDRFFVVDAQC